MSIQHDISLFTSTIGGSRVGGANSEIGGTETNIDSTFAAATSESSVACSFSSATLQSLMIVSNRNMTLKTNSSSSPATTIALKANIPFAWWRSGSYFANPMSAANVTSLFVTCTEASRLQVKVLVT